MTVVSASSMIAAALPWPHSVARSENSDSLLIRDLQHNSTIEIPCRNLLTLENAVHHIWSYLYTYRVLIDAWHGRSPIIWS